MLAQDSGELVVFLLLIGGGNGLQIGQRVFVLADVVGLDVVLEQAFGGEVELVGITPDGITLLDVGGILETLELRVIGEVFRVK